MIKHLKNNFGKTIDAEHRLGETTLKRGTFVKKVYDTSKKYTKIMKATSFAEAEGVLVRDVVVDVDVAMGLPVSDFSDTQDICKDGEYVGVEPVVIGEEYATTEYDSTLVDADVLEGNLLLVVDGKITKSSEGVTGNLRSLGWYTIGEHKMLAFRVVANVVTP